MDEVYLQKIKEFSEEEILDDMNNIYKQMCKMEDLSYEHAYGFGMESIKEYISSIILFKFIDLDKKKYIKGAIRLLIIGDFGAINFSDFIQYICLTKLNISEKTFEEGLKIIEENFKTCINSELAHKRTKKSSFIDLDEYIFILDNVNFNDKFRKNKTEMELESEIEKHHKKKRIYKRVIAILCILIMGIVGGIYYVIYSNNKNGSSASYKNATSNNSTVSTNNSDKSVSKLDDSKVDNSSTDENSVDSQSPEDDSPTDTPSIDDYSEDDQSTYDETITTDIYSPQPNTYLIEDSDTRYLNYEDIYQFTAEELGYVRNEIYARHGYIFKTQKYIDYFNSKSWYYPNEYLDEDQWSFLSDIEKANVKLIKATEESLSGN